jgi:integrase
MSHASYGADSRRPVYSGTRRVAGLYERTVAQRPRGLAAGDGDPHTVYEARLRLGGKVRRHTLNARTKTDAIAELRALQTDYERGQKFRSPAAALTLDELARDYLSHLERRTAHGDARRRRSARTVELYRQRFEDHVSPVLGHRFAGEITVADVRRLVDLLGAKRIERAGVKRPLSPSTITGTVNVLSGLLRFGTKQGVVERNVVRDLDRDDRPGAARVTEPRYLDPSEVAALLAQLGDTFRPIASVCAFAGLRVSEALALRWRDVDFKAQTVTVDGQLGPGGARVPTKTLASSASVPLLPQLAVELTAHRDRVDGGVREIGHRDRLIFATRRGRPQTRRNVLRAVYKAGDAAGLNEGREKVGIHDLRHSFVAIALASGLTLPETAELARHASPRVTASVYAGLTDVARAQLGSKLAAAFGSSS